MPHRRIGRYVLLRELSSEGGIAEYIARDDSHGHTVTLRAASRSRLAPSIYRRETALYQRHAEITHRLAHPGIVKAVAGEQDGVAFCVTPQLDAVSLREGPEGSPKLPVAEALRVMAEVCDMLAEVHSKGFVHRNVKPSKILIETTGPVRLHGLDSALYVGPGSTEDAAALVGTPAYMSPELIAGRCIDKRADIFGCGIVFYRMLTGAHPFPGDAAWQIASAILNKSPEPASRSIPAVSPACDRIAARALARDPGMRYADVRDLATALRLEMQLEMERSLQSLLDAGECFEPYRAVALVRAILRELALYHGAGLLHRNVHPACVFIRQDGVVRLGGFALATAHGGLRTQGADLSGEVATISPEQIRGERLDDRTDFFHVGLILYRLLTGRAAYSGEGIWSRAKRMMGERPAPPSSINSVAPASLDEVIAIALASEPDRRFQSASEFESRLKAILG